MSQYEEDLIRSQITIPIYFSTYIDNEVNLLITPKICCPFHKENTPSFSYSYIKGVWRCFGKCKFGGDVIDLHYKNKNLSSREEAIRSLLSILNINIKYRPNKLERKEIHINEEEIKYKILYNKAINLATTIDRWVELDYVMSFTESYDRLNDLVCGWQKEGG